MDLRKKGFQLPKRIQFDEESLTGRYGRLVAEPFERGFGITIGNSLRRVILSSIEGAAVTNIRIPGVLHEFASVVGVREDVTDIILNVKKLRLLMHGSGERKIYIRAKGPKSVTAADIEADSAIEVLNPELLIATLDKDADFEMEMTVRKGRGFVSADQNKEEDQPLDVIPIDAIFTPIELCNYEVESARVGRSTNYDRLYMDIRTDGSLTPEDALTQAAMILSEHLDYFIMSEEPECDESDPNVNCDERDFDDEPAVYNDHLLKSVEELELSVRAYNCLKNAGIKSIADLVQRSEPEMLKTKNFGRKSLNEIKMILKSMSLRFGMRIDKEAFDKAMASGLVTGGGTENEA